MPHRAVPCLTNPRQAPPRCPPASTPATRAPHNTSTKYKQSTWRLHARCLFDTVNCRAAHPPGTPALPPGFNPATWMLEVTGGSMATVIDTVQVGVSESQNHRPPPMGEGRNSGKLAPRVCARACDRRKARALGAYHKLWTLEPCPPRRNKVPYPPPPPPRWTGPPSTSRASWPRRCGWGPGPGPGPGWASCNPLPPAVKGCCYLCHNRARALPPLITPSPPCGRLGGCHRRRAGVGARRIQVLITPRQPVPAVLCR